MIRTKSNLYAHKVTWYVAVCTHSHFVNLKLARLALETSLQLLAGKGIVQILNTGTSFPKNKWLGFE